jgi:4-amino-4-deoxy-L-arabinose transferase-like glycosyltransferase
MDGRSTKALRPVSRFALFSWLPLLWSRVLFPGTGETAGPWRWAPLLWLVVLPGLLLYPCLGFALLEPDESRYAEVPREMLARGDLIVPVLQGEPYLEKPPLLYWLVAGCYRLFGTTDAAARLPSALAVHATVLLAYLFGRRLLGERSAFRGALLLGLAPGLMSVGRLLILDGLLTLWVTLALFAAFEATRGDRLGRGWWLLASAALGLGVLTKGPVALVLVLPPLVLHRGLSGRGCALGWWAWLGLVGGAVAVALPWYIALCVRVPEFARTFFWEHHVVRFFSGMAHVRGVWFYGPVLFLGLLPGSLLVWPFLRFLFGGEEETARRRTPELGFLLLAAGWCVLFFTVSACKLPTYILPALPPLALALGHFLAHSRWQSSQLPRWAAGVAFAALALLHHLALPWYATYRSPMSRPDVVRRYCADPSATVVCYPRSCDSVAFYLGRADLRNYRSEDIEALRQFVRTHPRTVVLCTHRHSLRGLKQLLPPEVRVTEEARLGLAAIPGVPERLMEPLAGLMGETAHGLCDVAVVERGPAPVAELPLARRVMPRAEPDSADNGS